MKRHKYTAYCTNRRICIWGAECWGMYCTLYVRGLEL